MTKYISNLTKNLSRVLALIFALPLLCAWVSPVDLTADINGTGSVSISGTDINSCTLDAAATTCHRWDLIWESVNDGSALTQQSDWVSNVPNDAGGNEWRLPTIKELTRLIAFGEKDTDTLIESATIKNWFTGDDFFTNVDNQTDLGTGDKTVWLISSSYRDIDENVGDDAAGAKGQAQVFAINIINGEIKTFEPGYKEDADGAPDGNELRLCDALNSTGGCTTYGDTTVNNVFALKVRTQSVTDLL
jgi:hypothetical protein